ncbi:MAG: amidohydrolase family protein [bacterium]
MKTKLDYLIKNATVFDGENTEPQKLTVGIQGQKIAYVGQEFTATIETNVIDARGLFLCPGFIDTHASTGFGYTLPHAGDHKLYQGVTTEIIGNCGASPAPIGEMVAPEMRVLAEQIGFDFVWRSLADWLSLVEKHGVPLNFGTHIGHNTVRAGVAHNPEHIARHEMQNMLGMAEQGMRDGSLGVSTGLVYAPGSFADTAEVIEFAKVSARHGGMYASHIRNEREAVEDAVEDAIEVGRAAQIRVLISHLKTAERPNWGKMSQLLEQIRAAQREGIAVSFEVYPYTAVSTKLSTFIPKESLTDGIDVLPQKLTSAAWRHRCVHWLHQRQTQFDRMILITESASGVQGKSIAEIAGKQERDPAEVVVNLLIADPAAWIVYDCMDQADVDLAVIQPDSIICSDSWSYPVNAKNTIGNPHPRTYGAFTRFLERYVLKKEQMPFGQAIRKITSIPADFVGFPGRGRIHKGCYADLVLLDPATLKEKATYENPRQFSEGTEYLWVNGTLAIREGELLSCLQGHIIRRPVHEK